VPEPNPPINAAVVAGRLAQQATPVARPGADVEQMLRTQRGQFDRAWVRSQLAEMYGAGDPRLSAWDEIVRDVPA
jgi:hypothetical protein